MFSGYGSIANLPAFGHRSAHISIGSEGRNAGGEGSAKQHHLQALQNTFKILLNSFYGYLGFGQGHFADFDAAARVTQIGRDLLKKMIDWLGAHGAKVIEVDTDGIYFVPPSSVAAGVSPAKRKPMQPTRLPLQKRLHELQKGLGKELPEGIEIDFDEQFDAMFSYKAKNYALLTKDGEVVIKGASLNRADSKNSSARSWSK